MQKKKALIESTGMAMYRYHDHTHNRTPDGIIEGMLIGNEEKIREILAQVGGCDAVLVDLVVGEYKVSGMGATDLVAGPALADDNYGIGFRKEDAALRDKVQELLVEMKADGTLAEICKKWFTEDITVVP